MDELNEASDLEDDTDGPGGLFVGRFSEPESDDSDLDFTQAVENYRTIQESRKLSDNKKSDDVIPPDFVISPTAASVNVKIPHRPGWKPIPGPVQQAMWNSSYKYASPKSATTQEKAYSSYDMLRNGQPINRQAQAWIKNVLF